MPPRPLILVSACLAGLQTRYDDKIVDHPRCREALEGCTWIPVCPEQLGGLPTPRQPCERQGDRVVGRDGTDLTAQFQKGAEQVTGLALKAGCREAILKARSPSCGVGRIYDGTFSGRRIPGHGVLAEALLAAGLSVRTEDDPAP